MEHSGAEAIKNNVVGTYNTADMAEKYGVEAFCNASHEQYTFPYYPNYLPDHMERLELISRLMHEYGCKPVFYPEGILGNTAWD